MLLSVLWVLGMLALPAAETVRTAWVATRTAEARRDTAVAGMAAEGGIRQAMFLLLTAREDPAVQTVRSRIGPAETIIAIENQAGKINPNLAGVPLLRGLLSVLGEPPDAARAIAEAMVDWRTPAPMSAGGGLKTDIYRAAGRTYGPPGRLFRSIDEIGLIPGVTPGLLARLRPHLCLYLDNAVTAGKAVGPVAQAAAAAGEEELSFPSADRVFLVSAVSVSRKGARAVRRAMLRFAPGGVRMPAILEWESE